MTNLPFVIRLSIAHRSEFWTFNLHSALRSVEQHITHHRLTFDAQVMRNLLSRSESSSMALTIKVVTALALLCLSIIPEVDSFHTVAKWTYSTSRSASAASTAAPGSSAIGEIVLDQMSSSYPAARDYAEMFGLGGTEAGLYCLLDSMRKSGIALGLKGLPFVLKKDEITKAMDLEETCFGGFFTIHDLEQALEDDFLDASRGSTDNRKGWKIAPVSNPRGDSFEDARMRFEDVQAAMEKGTVIFNAAGAHIPKLAGPCLAVTDAASTPNALNLYVTAAGKRTSAPPHTDKQDVLVVQTSGRKAWRVYMPTDPAQKPMSDLFARGKGDDNLPLYTLEESGTLLIETTLEEGDVLFVPAGFPHTTGTALNASENDNTSLHMTFNIDTHVWELDYLSARRLALRRSCVEDPALGQSREEENRYIGKVNELSKILHQDLFAELPLGFLDEEVCERDASIEAVTSELMAVAKKVDADTFSQVDESVWRETIETLRKQGMELVDIHRDMYLAAIEEGRTREAEEAMTAHLDGSKKKAMTPERMQRLSLFRVQRYYESINKCEFQCCSLVLFLHSSIQNLYFCFVSQVKLTWWNGHTLASHPKCQHQAEGCQKTGLLH